MMPPEETTKEEVEAREVGLAIAGDALHPRFKLKQMAERCLVPEVGRAVGNMIHIRVDEFGNPEILYNRHLMVRLTLDGIRLSKDGIQYHDRPASALMNTIVHGFTDYKFTGYGWETFEPKNLNDRIKKSGLERHGSAYGGEGDNCSVCKKYRDTYFAEIKAMNKIHDEFVESQRIKWPKNDGDVSEDECYPLIPYGESPSTRLPSPIEEAYADMKQKRGWKRKDK